MPPNSNTFPSSFIPTTNIWDVSEIYQVDVTSPEFKELLVRLYQNLNNMSLSMNSRDAGIYSQEEFINGQLFFPDTTLTSASSTNPSFRQAIRMTIDFGALPNAGAKSVAHNIVVTDATTWTRIYATATDPLAPEGIPVPNNQLSVGVTNVTITTIADMTRFTRCIVVLEYLQN